MKDLISITAYCPDDSRAIVIGDCVYFGTNSSIREKI